MKKTLPPALIFVIAALIFVPSVAEATTNAGNFGGGSGSALLGGGAATNSGVAIGTGYASTYLAPTNGLIVQGNVGIGTTTPQSKMDIYGGVSVGTSYAGVTAAPTNGLIVQGGVAIGTTFLYGHGTTMLDVVGADVSVEGGSTVWNSTPVSVITSEGGGKDLVLKARAGNYPDLLVATNGNVGIGTTTPLNALDVYGAAVVGTGYAGVDTAPTNGLLVQGDVGIGTATQQGLLTVYGASTVASAASAKLDYVSLPAATTTITGTTAITTAKGFNAASFYQPTYTDASAVTITNAATLYVDNAPAAAGSVTITKPWAISVGAGNVNFPGTGNVLGTITSGTWNGSPINLSSYASGTLQAAQFPALTGDVTTSSGSLSTTVAKIQGTTVSGTTGTGNVVFSASPTLTGTVTGANSNWSGNVGIGTATQQGLLTVYGASTVASAASAKLDYVSLPAATTTITGTTAITTAKGFNAASFYQPTYTDASAVTITNAATLYVDNAPAAAGSATITNPWAISVGAGNVSFPGTGNALGTITSGTWNGSAINLSSYASGTLQAAQEPAHTGDVTNTAGSLATTVAKIQGTTVSGTTGSGNVVFSASPTLTGTVTGASSNWSGKVGIGTSTPQSLVHAYGGEVQVGSSGTSCATANNGAIRYSGSTLYYCTGTTWTALGGTKSTLQFNNNNTPYFAATTYYTGVSCAGSGSGNCPANIPYAGTMKNMIVTVSVAPGTGNSVTVALQINGSSVNETCTISNTATSCQDTTHTDSVSVGGLVQVQAVYSASATPSTLGAAVEYDSP